MSKQAIYQTDKNPLTNVTMNGKHGIPYTFRRTTSDGTSRLLLATNHQAIKGLQEFSAEYDNEFLDIMYSQQALEVQVYLRDGRVMTDLFTNDGYLTAYGQAKNYASRLLAMFKDDVICIDIVANRS